MRLLQLYLPRKETADSEHQIYAENGTCQPQKEIGEEEEWNKNYNVSSNPHVRDAMTTSRIMQLVVIALLLLQLYSESGILVSVHFL